MAVLIHANALKTSLKVLGISLAAFSFYGCSGSDKQAAAVTEPEATETSISVSVRNLAGDPISGAAVSMAGDNAVTSGDGKVSFIANSSDNRIVTVIADGYMRQQKASAIADLGSDSAQTITLMPMVAAGQINAGTGGVATGQTGATVTVNADSLIDEEGNPVTGEVDVFITAVDVSDEEQRMLFPGGFEARTADDTEQTIHSYGMADFTFRQGDNELQLKEGSTAQITLPMDLTLKPTDDGLGMQLVAGDIVPLWYYDYEQSLWIEDGSGTVIDLGGGDLATVGDVTHFTPWNSDGKSNNAHVTVKLQCRQVGINNQNTGQVSWPTSAYVTWSSSYFGYAARVPYQNGWDGQVGDTMPGETCWTVDEAYCPGGDGKPFSSPRKCTNLSANGRHSEVIYYDVH